VIVGLGGDDTILSDTGNYTVCAGSGDDVVLGENDVVSVGGR